MAWDDRLPENERRRAELAGALQDARIDLDQAEALFGEAHRELDAAMREARREFLGREREVKRARAAYESALTAWRAFLTKVQHVTLKGMH